jgi:hypothetical protein
VDVDRVEDSKDFNDHILSSNDDDGPAIPAKPLDGRSPPRAGKKVLLNFSINAL